MAAARSGLMAAFGKAMSVSMGARVFQVAFSVLAARMLSPVGFGAFTFALGLGLLGGRLGAMGIPILVTRFLPRYREKESWDHARGLLKFADRTVLIASVMFALAIVGVATLLGDDHKLWPGLMIGAVLVPVMAFRSLYRNVLATLKFPQHGIAVDELFAPLISTVVLVSLLGLAGYTVLSVTAVTMIYIGASFVAVLVALRWIKQHVPADIQNAVPVYRVKFWIGAALPAMVGMSAKLFMNKTDVLMLAPLSTFEQVGLYGAAMRVTYLQTAPIVVLSTVVAVRISSAIAKSQFNQAKRLLAGSLMFALVVSSIGAAVFAAFATPIMVLLFGIEYAAGGDILFVLALAQVCAALSVSATSFLLMSGHQMLFSKMTIFALVLNVGANFMLIPTMGAVGAAIATAMSIGALAVLQLSACYYIIKTKDYREKE